MQIRKTQPQDLGAVLNIYQQARDFMRELGNPSQWGESWPPSHLIEEDILQQKSYVCVESLPPTADTSATEAVVAVFFLEMADDPTYHQIYQGQWIEPQQPYGVVHRLASSRRIRGAATFCLQWALEQCGNIRIVFDPLPSDSPLTDSLMSGSRSLLPEEVLFSYRFT